jgi:alkyl hydroperoxide reductase subunit AhpC
MTTGRNFDEVLRVIDSLQLTAQHKLATPAQWNRGDKVIVTAAVPDDEAREKFGEFEQPKPYIRLVPDPS